MALSKTHITNCVRNPQCIKDPILRGGSLQEKPGGGAPLSWGGGFSTVFKILKNGEYWAFKVWHTSLNDMETRYASIKAFLGTISLPYFVKFDYEPKGLYDGNSFIATHRMKWIDGVLLSEYIEENIDSPKKIISIANQFRKMVNSFHVNNISHGDLQHGNILIRRDGTIRVIDYDSMYVNGLSEMPDIIEGQGGYQHPQRRQNEFAGNFLDNFSELIIYLSLLVYAERPELWDIDADRLLFSKDDLANPTECPLLNQLIEDHNPLIKYLASKIMEFLRYDSIADIPSLSDVLLPHCPAAKPSTKFITDKF